MADAPNWLGKLYDEHAEGLYRYFLGATRRQEEAKDLLQDLFVKVARNPACLDGVRQTRNYLFRMAHNQVVDWSRRVKVRQGGGTEPAETACLFAASSDDDPDAGEFRSQLNAGLRELPEEQSEVLRLKLWEALTFEEIAKITGASQNTTASRYRYGMDKLRTILRPLYDELN